MPGLPIYSTHPWSVGAGILVLLLVAVEVGDLNSPRGGFIRVSQASLIELRDSLAAAGAASGGSQLEMPAG